MAAIPALDLRLALPNATSLPEDDPARVTYELTGEHYGEGFNGPLLLTGSIITSEDPLGLMDDIADAVREVPGVADVPLAPRTRALTPASSRSCRRTDRTPRAPQTSSRSCGITTTSGRTSSG